MNTVKRREPKLTIIRLSNLNEVKNISPGLYYYLDFSTNEIYYFDYRKENKQKKEMKFKNFEEFDKFLKKEFK